MANTRRRALIFCFIDCQIHAGHVLMDDGAHKEDVSGWLKCLTDRSEVRARDRSINQEVRGGAAIYCGYRAPALSGLKGKKGRKLRAFLVLDSSASLEERAP
jgi:hypothetical protein